MNRATVIEIFRFICSGGISLLVQLGLLYLLAEVIGWWYLISAVIAHAIAISINFILQKFFVSRDFETSKIKSQLVSFGITALSYIVINALAMYVLVSLLHWPYIAAQSIVVFILSVATFIIYRSLIFR